MNIKVPARRGRYLPFVLAAAGLVLAFSIYGLIGHFQNRAAPQIPDWVDIDIIPICSGRDGRALDEVNSIVIHYIGNPGTTAKQNRHYFASIGTKVCSHFIVGLDGEVIQCVPLSERSVASNERNSDTISIEVCHPDETGEFNEKTYLSLVKLTAWLCREYRLDEMDVIRHYDITGKLCPLYFVEHEDAWDTFRSDLAEAIKEE